MENIEVNDTDVLKRLGTSLVTENGNYDKVKVDEEQVKYILENKNISFEHKKEIFEKIKLLKLFSYAYIGPDQRGNNHLIFQAKRIFEVKDENDFEEKIKVVNKVLQFLQKAAMNPYEMTKRQMEDEIKYKDVIF